MIFEMNAFFILINIGPCHGNPRLLPTLVLYWVMSRHPKIGICQTKMDKGGIGDDLRHVSFLHSN